MFQRFVPRCTRQQGTRLVLAPAKYAKPRGVVVPQMSFTSLSGTSTVLRHSMRPVNKATAWTARVLLRWASRQESVVSRQIRSANRLAALRCGSVALLVVNLWFWQNNLVCPRHRAARTHPPTGLSCLTRKHVAAASSLTPMLRAQVHWVVANDPNAPYPGFTVPSFFQKKLRA